MCVHLFSRNSSSHTSNSGHVRNHGRAIALGYMLVFLCSYVPRLQNHPKIVIYVRAVNITCQCFFAPQKPPPTFRFGSWSRVKPTTDTIGRPPSSLFLSPPRPSLDEPMAIGDFGAGGGLRAGFVRFVFFLVDVLEVDVNCSSMVAGCLARFLVFIWNNMSVERCAQQNRGKSSSVVQQQPASTQNGIIPKSKTSEYGTF